MPWLVNSSSAKLGGISVMLSCQELGLFVYTVAGFPFGTEPINYTATLYLHSNVNGHFEGFLNLVEITFALTKAFSHNLL